MTAPFPVQTHSEGWQTVTDVAQLTTACLAPEDVELANQFFRQPRLCEFMAEGGIVRGRWEYSATRLESFVVLQGDDVQLLAHVAPSLPNKSADERPWWEYPSDVQPLAWALENASILEILQRLFGRLLTVTRVVKADDTKEFHARQHNDLQQSLKLYFEEPDSRHSIRLRLSTSALLSLACNQRWIDTKPQRVISRLVFDAVIAMPLGFFNLRELREIATGDVLLTGFSTLSNLPFQLTLSGSGNRWSGRGGPHHFVIETELKNDPPNDSFQSYSLPSYSLQSYSLQSYSPQSHSQQSYPLQASLISMDTIADIEEVVQSPSSEGALSLLDKLNIELSLQVDKRQLSLREIEQLQPGFVFTLPQAVNELTLTFLANNIPVGRGELVAIGKQLGVRVIEWNTHGL